MLFYLCFPSSFYNFDGVACAIAVETADGQHLAHGNHLAFGLLGFLFYELWRLLGYTGPAIAALQVLCSILGAIGIGLFNRLLLGLGLRPALAALGACGLALSQSYWFWSMEAQVYPLGWVFIIAAASEILASKPRPVRLGLLHAAAVLGHVGHALFLPAILYRLRRRGPLSAYLGTTAAALGLSYGLTATLLIKPSDFSQWREWLLGSAALSADKSPVWFGGYSWTHLGEWAKMSTRLLADWPSLESPWRAIALALSGLLLAFALATAWRRKEEPVVRACLIWVASYALLFSSWQPWTIVYRISDLIPLWILAAIGLKNRAKTGLTVAASLIGGVGILNGYKTIIPRADPNNNTEYQEALWLKARTPAHAWIITSSLGQVYVPYFAQRRPLNLRYYPGKLLWDRISVLAARGEPVFVLERLLGEQNLLASAQTFGLREEARRRGRALYRLKQKENPRAAGKKN